MLYCCLHGRLYISPAYSHPFLCNRSKDGNSVSHLCRYLVSNARLECANTGGGGGGGQSAHQTGWIPAHTSTPFMFSVRCFQGPECEVLCWECVCAVCVCEMFVWLLVHVSTNFYGGCLRLKQCLVTNDFCLHNTGFKTLIYQSYIVSAHTTHAPTIEVGRYMHEKSHEHFTHAHCAHTLSAQDLTLKSL